MDLNDLKFTEAHEWVYVDGDVATVGISDYAQGELGDVVYVELPPVGESYDKGDTCSSIESVKAASDVYSPLSGEITEGNEKLEDAPELVNQEPYGNGWFFKIRMSDTSELDELMDYAKYQQYVKGLQEE